MASANTERLIELINEKGLAGVRIDVDELTRRVIEITGDAIKVPPAEIKRRLDQIAEMAILFGTVGRAVDRKASGFLVRSQRELADLAMGLNETRARVETIEAIDKAMPKVAEALAYVDTRLTEIDEMFKDLGRALMEWQMSLMQLIQIRRNVAGGLDGWSQMAEAWNGGKIMAAKANSPDPLERNVIWIAQNLPYIPPCKINSDADNLDLDD